MDDVGLLSAATALVAYSRSALTAMRAFAATFPCCEASSHSFSSAASSLKVATKGGRFDGDFPAMQSTHRAILGLGTEASGQTLRGL